jgi:Protein of unknown function (DUF938)
MLHIAPWATCAALMHGSARHLTLEGLLMTYGTYREEGASTATGNQDFERDLCLQNWHWGVRRREDVEHQAALAGLRLVQRLALPANNLLLVWARRH